jgi:hypothetical protein
MILTMVESHFGQGVIKFHNINSIVMASQANVLPFRRIVLSGEYRLRVVVDGDEVSNSPLSISVKDTVLSDEVGHIVKL